MGLRLAVFASHGGSNLQAILDSCLACEIDAHVAVVVSNNSTSRAFARAENAKSPTLHISSVTHPDPKVRDMAIRDALIARNIDLVVLAGYMKKLGPHTLGAFHNRVINIHPGPLPEFGGEGMYGEAVHRAVLASGVKESGATVHIVDEVYDHGRILTFSPVPVLPGDTVDELAARVLIAEHLLYPATIGQIASGDIRLA